MAVINSVILQRPVYRMLLITAVVTPLCIRLDDFIDAIDMHLFRQVFEKLRNIKPLNRWRTWQDNHSPTFVDGQIKYRALTKTWQRRQWRLPLSMRGICACGNDGDKSINNPLQTSTKLSSNCFNHLVNVRTCRALIVSIYHQHYLGTQHTLHPILGWRW